ncbi:hypothetical protein [Haloferula sp. BvORR071]|uniref:hypothetical protein n=1 Tax=Haloferula sp. BvORR071 TaxID=1396141 RepID=UPI0005567D4A|nr:hypothetical protein [Haloferula sp. BvORR071]
MIRKLLGGIATLLLALLSTSCFEQSVVIKVNKDGSGTITETTLLSAKISALLDNMGEQSPLSKMTDKAKAGAYAAKIGPGVELEKAGVVERGDKKGTEIVYHFKDINSVAYTMGGSMQEANKASIPANLPEEAKADQKPVTFKYADGTLTIVNPSSQAAPAPAPVPDANAKPAPKPDIDLEKIAQAKDVFKDMRMSFKVELPGGISESDATYVDGGNTVVMMDVDFGKLIEDPEKLKKLVEMGGENPAAGAALFKDTPGVRNEPKEQVTVKVK